MPDISKKTFIWAISGLILLRVILVVLMMNNVPFTDMQLGGFRPHFNESYMPDEQKFFDIGKGLATGKIINSSPSNIGYGLFLAPFIYFYDAKEPIDIAKPIFIFQEFMLFPVALILVALIAIYLFKSHFWAAISAGLFAVYPWLILGFGKIIGYRNAIPAFHHQLWIIIQSDYLSALFVYLSFFLILKWFDELFKQPSVGYLKLIFLGFSGGASLLFKMTNIWLILIIFATFLYFKQYKKALSYGLCFAIVYSPQLIFNMFAFGALWTYGYISKQAGVPYSILSMFNISNFWLNFKNFSPHYYFFLFLILAAFFILIFIFGRYCLGNINKKGAIITAAWFWSYLLFFGAFMDSTQSLRYFLPAVPVFIYFFIGSLIYFTDRSNLIEDKYLNNAKPF